MELQYKGENIVISLIFQFENRRIRSSEKNGWSSLYRPRDEEFQRRFDFVPTKKKLLKTNQREDPIENDYGRKHFACSVKNDKNKSTIS